MAAKVKAAPLPQQQAPIVVDPAGDWKKQLEQHIYDVNFVGTSVANSGHLGGSGMFIAPAIAGSQSYSAASLTSARG